MQPQTMRHRRWLGWLIRCLPALLLAPLFVFGLAADGRSAALGGALLFLGASLAAALVHMPRTINAPQVRALIANPARHVRWVLRLAVWIVAAVGTFVVVAGDDSTLLERVLALALLFIVLYNYVLRDPRDV